jgi:threonine/homoserine/homoserine lactone efflux protein
MIEPLVLVRGVAIGFTIAAAVGPISLLTIRRTLAHGRVYGLVSGLGVATADATYAGIAAFGLTAVTGLLVGASGLLALVGGAFLAWLGWTTFRSAPVERPMVPAEAAGDRPRLPAAWLSILGLTLTNPATILSFAGVFAAAGLATHGPADAALITLGVFLGSTLWWIVLTTAISALRSRITLGGLRWVNRASGIVLLAFGVVAVATAVATAVVTVVTAAARTP